MRWRKDLLYLVVLLFLALFFWSNALAPGKVLFRGDLSSDLVPNRWFWVHSPGAWLWNPYIFFGTPCAANPQTESFYPLNFLYMLFGPERGLVYYIILHHVLLLFFTYAALRRLGFAPESGLAGSLGFGFGGFAISIASIVTILSTLAWFPLLILLLDKAWRGKWLRSSLLAGAVVCLQVLAGEIEMAAMSWIMAIAAVALGPDSRRGARSWASLLGSFALAFATGTILAFPQIALTWQMIPISNRGQGLSLTQALEFSVFRTELISMLIPSFILPQSSYIHLQNVVVKSYPYLESCYLGIGVIILAIAALFMGQRGRSIFLALIALFGLSISLGGNLPVYAILFRYIPFFSLFRIPAKFMFFTGFCAAMLAAFGCQELLRRNLRKPATAGLFMVSAFLTGLLLIFLIARLQNLASQAGSGLQYPLLGICLRLSSFFLVMAALIFLIGRSGRLWAGAGLCLVIFMDLCLAHRGLNPVTGPDFYQPDARIRQFMQANSDRIVPIRIFVIAPTKEEMMSRTGSLVSKAAWARDSLFPFWPLFFHINDVKDRYTLHVLDYDHFLKLYEIADNAGLSLALSRMGAEAVFNWKVGFIPLSSPAPRASVFYSARTVTDQNQAFSAFVDPNFPAQKTLLYEGSPGEDDGEAGNLMSDPAQIVSYENQRVVVKAFARKNGWLLLLDAYYPGWKATVDGKPAAIYRADGFFRAVPIPAGQHQVVFSYFPKIFQRALLVSGIGLVLGVALLAAGLSRGRKAADRHGN